MKNFFYKLLFSLLKLTHRKKQLKRKSTNKDNIIILKKNLHRKLCKLIKSCKLKYHFTIHTKLISIFFKNNINLL